MSALIDSLNADWLRPGITLGAATERVEKLVAMALELKIQLMKSQLNEADVADAINKLYSIGADELCAIFSSSGPALTFLVADQVPPLSPPIARYISIHASLSKALLGVQDRLAADRALLSRASEELERGLAQHADLVTLIRDGNATSEVLFQKLVLDPAAAPAISKLLNVGLTQNALWDLIKLLLTVVVVGS